MHTLVGFSTRQQHGSSHGMVKGLFCYNHSI